MAEARILLIEDDEDSRLLLRRVLERAGMTVVEAETGTQGLRELYGSHPDVVLLDIGLPKLNGYEACRRIREQPWGKRVVLIAVTGWGQEEDRRCSHEAGFDHHVVKPVDPQELRKLLAGLQTVMA